MRETVTDAVSPAPGVPPLAAHADATACHVDASAAMTMDVMTKPIDSSATVRP